MAYGKRLKKAYETVDTNKVYSLEEAVRFTEEDIEIYRLQMSRITQNSS